MNERRADVGLKVVWVGLTALITLLLSLFFNKTYNLAESACATGSTNAIEIVAIKTKLDENIKVIERRLGSIDTKLDKLIDLK